MTSTCWSTSTQTLKVTRIGSHVSGESDGTARSRRWWLSHLSGDESSGHAAEPSASPGFALNLWLFAARHRDGGQVCRFSWCRPSFPVCVSSTKLVARIPGILGGAIHFLGEQAPLLASSRDITSMRLAFMEPNPQLQYVKEQVDYEIGLYTRRKHFNRQAAFAFTVVPATLAALATVSIGASEKLGNTWLPILAMVATGI